MPNSKKHILILPKWYPNKNDIQLGIFIKNQAILLSEHFDISVIYVQSDDTISENYQINSRTEDGFFEQIVYFKKSTSIFKKLINFKRYKKAQKLAYKNIIKAVDLCHVHVPIRPAFLAQYLLRTKQIPFVITEHWSGHLTGEFEKRNKLYKTLYKKTLLKASKISCVSAFLCDQFIKNTGLTPTILPNYIESTEISPPPPTKKEIVNILSVSDFIDNIKNISGLLKAFKLATNENQKLKLTLVGGGPDELLIKSLVSDLAFNKDQIILTGRLKHRDVLAHMNQCDFYISNSNFETFGMTICEALLSGRPVVSTLSGGPNEFLHEGNSLTIKRKSPQQLVRSILKMSSSYQNYNPEDLSSEIKSKYGRQIILKKTTEFYSI